MKVFLRQHLVDITIVSFAIAINFFIHTYNLGRNHEIFTDSGVYLYASSLINQGFIPYRDFFLAHPPLLIYLSAYWLDISQGDVIIFHQIYILWLFSALIPLYFLSFFLTKSRLAGIFSILLFSTFPELVQWDGHTFALRHASIPFFAYALWLFFQFQKQTLFAIFLALFALTSISNLSLSLVMILLISIKQPLIRFRKTIAIYSLIVIIYYLAIFLIPNSYNNIITFQQARISDTLPGKIDIFIATLTLNWPLIIFGLLGSIIAIIKKSYSIGLFNLVALPIIIFSNSYFYGHYITILAPTFAVSAAYLLSQKKPYFNFLIFVFCSVCIYQITFNYLYFHLIQKRTTQFNQTVDLIKQYDGKLLTFEPIFAIYSHKQIPFHYYVADARSLLVKPIRLEPNYFPPLIDSSDIIFLDNLMSAFMTQQSKNLIAQKFKKIDRNVYGTLYVRY